MFWIIASIVMYILFVVIAIVTISDNENDFYDIRTIFLGLIWPIILLLGTISIISTRKQKEEKPKSEKQ